MENYKTGFTTVFEKQKTMQVSYELSQLSTHQKLWLNTKLTTLKTNYLEIEQ